MSFNDVYKKIVENYTKSTDIMFSDELESFLSRNISNKIFSCNDPKYVSFADYTPVDIQPTEKKHELILEPSDKSLNFFSEKRESMANIVDRRDSVLRFIISANKYGETKITKQYVDKNGAFSENYDIDNRTIVTKIYDINDASKKYHEYGDRYTNTLATLTWQFDNTLEPISEIKAQIRGKYYVINSEGREILIPRENGTTLYSTYYNYMTYNGYFYEERNSKNINVTSEKK